MHVSDRKTGGSESEALRGKIDRRGWLIAAALIPVVVRAQPAGTRAPGELLIGGTGAGLGPLKRVAESVGTRTLNFVPNLGTGGGLKAVMAGAIDIALAARRLTDDEKSKGLVEREIFRTPMVWAVHEGVAVQRITLGDLAAIYAGRTVAWPNGVTARAVLRPESDADTRFLKSLGPTMSDAITAAHARPGVRVATTDTEATEAIERIAGAIGVTTLGLLRAEQRHVRILEVDGTAPNIETMTSKRYPYAKSIFAVTRGAPVGPTSDALMSLNSRAAIQVLTSIGCTAAA